MKPVAVSQRVEVLADRGEVRDALDQQLCRWLVVNGYLPIPVPNCLGDHLAAWLRHTAVEAIVLSGGNDIGSAPLRDQTEQALLDHAQAHDLPVLGICRGLQMMVVWAGGHLEPVTGHVATRHRLSGAWALPADLDVNSFHNLRPGTCPDAFEVRALAPDGTIEAIEHRRLRLQGWMWHPEREATFAAHDNARLKALFGA